MYFQIFQWSALALIAAGVVTLNIWAQPQKRGMLRAFLFLAAFAAAYCGGYATVRLRHPSLGAHFAIRGMAIASQAAQLKQVDWLLLGDSLVELANIPSLCGGSILNSGVGGAGVAEAIATLHLLNFRPKNIVVAIGVNDTNREKPIGVREFVDLYRHLVAAASATGAKVYVATIGPVARGMAYGDLYYDPELIGKFNADIRKIAAAGEDGIVDFSAMAGADGFLPAENTADGVHLKPSGYVVWRSILERSVCG